MSSPPMALMAAPEMTPSGVPHRAPNELAADALDGRRRDDALGRAADAPQQIDGRALADRLQRRRDVAVGDEHHPRARLAEGADALLVARAVEHDDHHISDVLVLALGDE